MFSKFSEDAQKALVLARKEMRALKHPYVGSEHLLLAILKNDNAVSRHTAADFILIKGSDHLNIMADIIVH